MKTPEVSVVMSVFNSADSIERTVESILSQQNVDLEFIVVNDGSTDDCREILDRLARDDTRLKAIHQENTGLTIALVRGCSAAQGRYIARQDAGGDVSLPGRLRAQLEFLRARPEAVMVSCGTRFVGPDDELLFDVVMNDNDLANGLATLNVAGIRGPSSHPSTMFSRHAYLTAGGYRPAFVAAQDIDLWLRLVELGRCLTIPQVLYQAQNSIGNISSRLRDAQLAFAAGAIECARSRRRGLPEPALSFPVRSWAEVKDAQDPDEAVKLNYFLGCCLREQDPDSARHYFHKVVRERPLHLKALWRYVFG